MSELLPCPWCGSNIRLSPINVPWSDNEPCWAIWHVDGTKAYEAKCPMEMGGYDTEAEAIAAWNTRAERTCRIVKTWSDSDYIDDWNYRCSECRSFIPVNERDPETGDVISAANYCPNCGRKVVSE